jgi:tetratricopeptide (TPR) repeat protein
MRHDSCRSIRLALALIVTCPAGLTAQADASSLTVRAARALAAEDFDRAVAAADSAAALAPERSSVQLILGQAYLSHARAFPSLGAIGKVKRGRAAVERAIDLDPDNLEARSTLLQFLLQAPGIVGGSRDGARVQAQEIERRDRPRGLLARLEVATAGRKKDELLAVYDDALPLLSTGGQSETRLARAFLDAAAKLKDRDLREALAARVYAAVPDSASVTP